MAIFLFLGIMSAAGLLYTAMTIKSEADDCGKPKYVLFMAATGLLAILDIAFNLNNPANFINILAKPTTGLSSAVISQIVITAAGIIIYVKNTKHKASAVISVVLFVYAVFCLNRLYMISTRHALNTYLLFFVFAGASALAAGTFLFSGSGDEAKHKKNSLSMLITSAVFTIFMAVFLVRLAVLNPPDRMLTIDMLISGHLSAVFWAMIVTCVIIPLALSAIRYMKNVPLLSYVMKVSVVIGIFLICVLVNQLPTVVKAIQGRMVF